MTWTYSGDPTDSDLDAVRFLVTDTDITDQLAQNEEIDYTLATFGGPIHAAAVVCEQIAGQFARSASRKKVGNLTIQGGDRAAHFADRCKTLRRLIATDLADILVGGLTISEKVTFGQDTNAVQPSFAKEQDDFPGTGDRATSPNRGFGLGV